MFRLALLNPHTDERHTTAMREVAPLDIPVAEQGSEHTSTTSTIVETGRRLVEERGAEALVLACGGMADVAAAVQAEAGVPVCDGVSFGSLLAHSLCRCGLATS